jgi:hypothetical protein
MVFSVWVERAPWGPSLRCCVSHFILRFITCVSEPTRRCRGFIVLPCVYRYRVRCVHVAG